MLILLSEGTDMYLKRFLGISKYTQNYFFRINLYIPRQMCNLTSRNFLLQSFNR